MRQDVPSKLLVVSMLPWIYPARLVGQLRDAGFEVEAACFSGSAIERVTPAVKVYALSPLGEASGLAAAIEAANPDFVVPCDDRATWLLHELHRTGGEGRRRLIERSLGDSSGFASVRSKRAVLAMAGELGLAVPRTVSVRGYDELEAEVARCRLPLVLKRDGTWGGKGVRILRKATDLKSAWRELTTRTPLQVLRGLRHHHSLAPVKEMLGLTDVAIDVQDFVEGLPANRAVVCDQGKVLAGHNALALETASETGAASVIRIVDNAQMERTAEALVARLGLSGFVGFDFVVCESGGEALLLEINPRATPIAHLRLDGRPHLPTVFATLHGAPMSAAVATPIKGETIALFPNELTRDPGSRHFATAVHDVPWDQPGLVALARKQLDQARVNLLPASSNLARASS